MDLEENVDSSVESFYVYCRACLWVGMNVSEWFPVNV